MSIPTQAFTVPGQTHLGQAGQGFPAPLGIEQGLGAAYGQQFAPIFGAGYGQAYAPAFAPAYGQLPGAFGTQVAPFGVPAAGLPYQQLQAMIQQIAWQIMPIVHQLVVSQIMQQLPHTVAQLAAGYPAAQYGYQQPVAGWLAAARTYPF
jgi:hypothetical protein